MQVVAVVVVVEGVVLQVIAVVELLLLKVLFAVVDVGVVCTSRHLDAFWSSLPM